MIIFINIVVTDWNLLGFFRTKIGREDLYREVGSMRLIKRDLLEK